MSPQEIADALARIERRQEEFERRLASAEANALRRRAPAPRQAGTRPGRLKLALPRFETAFGLTWLSRIAVVTVVLALAFFFEYAFENHWITVLGRMLLGFGSGTAALVAGERFRRTGQRTFAQALAAAGIGFFYLSLWAAFGLYHLISQPAAFGLMVLVTAAAGALAVRYDGAAMAMLGLAGGFATPLLLAAVQDPWFVLGYALVLDAGAAFAARARGWRAVEALALAGTVVLYTSQLPAPPDLRAAYTAFVAVFFALFSASALPGVAAAAPVLAAVAMAAVWSPAVAALWTACAVAAAALAVADRRALPVLADASFAGFWLAYGWWRLNTGYPADWAALAPATAAFLVFLGWPVWKARMRGRPLRIPDLLLIPLNAALYFGAGYGLLLSRHAAWEGLFAVLLALAHMAAARVLWRADARGAPLAAAAAWVALVLAAPIQFAGYRVTIAWALEGAALAWTGVRLREERAVNAALAMFLMVLVRLAAVDSFLYARTAAYPALLNARFLAFAVAAGALWSAAWSIRHGRRAAAVYIGGHVFLLWGLSLEAAGWASRTLAPSDATSGASVSISAMAAAYAVLLVAGGAHWRHVPTRLLGMALIALAILKLYVYDVWLLAPFYRMAAFAILGVLLMAMSYLYSRFRGSIETLWRP